MIGTVRSVATGLYGRVAVLGSRYSSLYARAPYAMAFATCCVKGMLSDVTAQRLELGMQRTQQKLDQEAAKAAVRAKQASNDEAASPSGEIADTGSSLPLVVAEGLPGEEGAANAPVAAAELRFRDTYSLKRTIIFTGFSSFYTGMAQHFVYNVLYTRLFGSGVGLSKAALVRLGMKKLLFDHVLHAPLVYLPVFYTYKAICFAGWSSPDFSLFASAREGLMDLWEDRAHVYSSYYAVWTIPQILTFCVIPPTFRIAFIGMVSYFYLVILSYLSHRKMKKEQLYMVADAIPVCEAGP